jgi:poly(3-hydroxybutyrate) depolymerase
MQAELGISPKKIFIGGHSQGGYIATRLNTMHATNGVIASAQGPLNMVYRSLCWTEFERITEGLNLIISYLYTKSLFDNYAVQM